MTRVVSLFLALFVFQSMWAQQFDALDFQRRRKQLDEAFQKENYLLALDLLKQQTQIIEKFHVYDSLYQYASFVGRCYWKAQNVAAANREAEKLIASVLRYDKDINHHLVALSELSWYYYETGHDSLCLKTDQRYLDICLSFDQVDELQLSNGYYNLGFDYLAVGKGKESVAHFRKSIEPLLKDSLKNAEELLKRYNALGSGLYRLGDYKRAKESYRKTLFYADLSKDEYQIQSNKANCYGNLSLVALDEGNFIEAKDFLEKSIKHRELAMASAPEPALLHQELDNKIKGYSNLASIYLQIGDFHLTEKLLNLSREEKTKLLEPDDPRLNLVDESFGSYFLAIGETDKALESIKRYKASCMEHYGLESFWTGFACKRLAQIYATKNQHDLAVDSFTDAISIFEKIADEESSQDLATCLIDRSKSYARIGNLVASRHDHDRAMAMLSGARNNYDPILAKCKFVMAQNYFDNGDYVQADLFINEAMAVLNLYRNHLSSYSGRLKGMIPYSPEILFLKAKIIQAANLDAEAKLQSMELIQQAIAEIRSTQLALDHNASRLELYDSHEELFHHGTDLLYDLYRSTQDRHYIDGLLSIAEENKTVLLRKQLSAFGSMSFSQVPDSIQQKENELLAKLQNSELNDEVFSDILKSEKELDAVLMDLSDRFPQYYEMKYGDKIAHIEDVQKELCGSGKNVIEFVASDAMMYVLVISSSDYHIVPLSRNGLSDLIHDFNNAVVKQDDKQTRNLGYELFLRIFSPFECLLSSHEVLIVPDEEIFNVNFDILQRDRNLGVKSMLIQDYTFSYLLSLTTALQFKKLQNKHDVKGMLALAPGFTDDQKESYSKMATGLKKLDDSFLKCIQQPFALNSAREFTRIIPGVCLIGNDATEENFRRNAEHSGIIHFGTHTEVNNESPLLSRLILSNTGEDSTSSNDGYLHAYEIYDLSLQAELAVLTACQTGTGKPNGSEGVFSLAYGFAYAGCPSVVMSLWQVDEKTSVDIVEKFYTNLADGQPRNEALRKAKLAYLESHDDELAAPYYWAGLVLMGETEPLDAGGQSHWPWMVLAIGLVALLTFFVIRKRK